MPSNTQSGQKEMAWLDAAVKRLKQGEAAGLIEETLEALTHDEKNTQLLHILSMAYSYQGHGDRAEPYARQALDLISKNRKSSPLQVEMVRVCLFDSLIAQGCFAEASRTLDAVVRRGPHTNAILLLMAWGYFLAGEEQNARRALARQVPHDPSTIGSDEIADVFPSYALMEPYMHYVLEIYPSPTAAPVRPVPQSLETFLKNGMKYMAQTTVDNMLPLLAQYLEKWEDEARRHAHNPYGKRLSEILEKARKLEWYQDYFNRITEAIWWRK